MRDEPQHVTAWAKGAEGERRLGAGLDSLASGSVRVLHDRRIPGSRANIDHLVVTPAGVYVIDAKRYKGKVEDRDKGGLFRTDIRLYVGGRDCTGLLDGMARQLEAVRDAIGDGPPVYPVLCFIEAEWGFFARPIMMGEVLVCWPRSLYTRIKGAGRGDIDHLAEVAARLASRLPPA